MTEAETFFNKLTGDIPDAKAGKMFGALCMKMPNGKSAAMFWKDCIIVKLQGQDFETAMSLNGGRLFEPMEGRLMKEWVQIPFEYINKGETFAEKKRVTFHMWVPGRNVLILT